MNNPLSGTDPSGYMGCAASKIQRVCDNTPGHWGGNGNYGLAKAKKAAESNGAELKVAIANVLSLGKDKKVNPEDIVIVGAVRDAKGKVTGLAVTTGGTSEEIQKNPNGLGDSDLEKAATPISNSASDVNIFKKHAAKGIARLEDFISLIESGDADTLSLIASTYGYEIEKAGFSDVTQMVLDKSKGILTLLRSAHENPSNIFRVNARGANGWNVGGNILLPNDFFKTGGPGPTNTLIHEFGHSVGMKHKGFVANWYRDNYMEKQRMLSKHANLYFSYQDKGYDPRQIAFDSQWSYDYVIATKYGEN